MTFTAATKCCVVEKLEGKIDKYERIIEEDQEVLNARKRVNELFGCLRDTLRNMPGAEEALKQLDELDDAIVQLDTEKLKALAGADRTNFQVIFDSVRGYLK